MKQAKIILLRHGQCEGGSILRGKTDVALTDLGLANMHQSAAKLGLLGCLPSLQLYSSPLMRCHAFAAELAQQLNQASADLALKVEIMSQLQEIDFGLWDGKSFTELYQHSAKALDAYWDNPWDNGAPQAEPMAEFEQRVAQAFAQITQQAYDLAKVNNEDGSASTTALVVTHGGVIRHIIALVLGLNRCQGLYGQLNIDYAATVTIDVFWPETDDKSTKAVYRLNWPS
ncbi:histidine phosphatase family protein [Shewanella sp. UCD-KL21]|uniref:histidine phosphatase family protein n=1 Tax=Shewanella sp. UCD-KL21 TaxID=1917164 RepID=UPI0009712155|nr:histidine phosphatase family protein [Shewanella sp. UCD-KL21]